MFSMVVLHESTFWSAENGKLKAITFDPFDRKRRQDRPPLFFENGSVYVFRPYILKEYNNRYGDRIGMFEMDYWKSFQIDAPEDVELCSYYFKKFLHSKSHAIEVGI